MSKKKIIVGIMGTTALITGDGAVNTVASVREVEETVEEENKKRDNQNRKQDKSKIRIKRENLNNNILIKNSFVEKIYSYNQSTWKLSLVLSKNQLLTIIRLFVENDNNGKGDFISETKKIITEIKNNSINLSAQEFDENAIDAFAHTIWKNLQKYCNLYLKLDTDKKIRITLYIENNKWIMNYKELFEIIGEKNLSSKNEEVKEIDPDFNTHHKNWLSKYVRSLINLNQGITIKYKNNSNIIMTLSSDFVFKIFHLINFHFKENINEFQNWFIIDIKEYITNNILFSNIIIPSNEVLKKIANKIFENIKTYNFLYLKKEIEKIKFNVNLKNISIEDQLIWNKYNYVQNSFVEKIYSYNQSTWKLSLVLSKNNWEKIIKIFINNVKERFIIETKKIITEIKNNSINLSAQEFDENAIDAFAHTIWKSFPYFYYDSFLNLGTNQKINIRLDIKNSEWVNANYHIIGKKTELEKKNKKQKIIINNDFTSKIWKNIIFNCKYNVIEKSTNSKFKIKINKITLAKINIFFFALQNNNDFIENLTKIFETFPPSYDDDSYKLNHNEIKAFAYLFLQNFSYYCNIFFKLEDDESIRIIMYKDDKEKFWTFDDFESHNEIVDKNNDVIDWTTFNNRYKDENKTKLFKHDQDFDIFTRKKRPNNSEAQPGPSKENLGRIVQEWFLGELPDNNWETILQRLDARNPWLRISQLNVENISATSATIVSSRNSNYYTGEIVVRFNLFGQQEENIPSLPENNLGSNPLPVPNSSLNDWKTKRIDLKNKMSIPMNFQEKETWCSLAVLQNILVNNIKRNHLIHFSQTQLNEYFFITGINIDEMGLYLYNLYRFINENPDIKNSLDFSYSYISLNSFFWFYLTDDQKMLTLQNLFWNSLNLNTPIPMHINLPGNVGHAILIIGIEPNEDPFQSLYLIRDPFPYVEIGSERLFLPNEQPNTERVINGKQMLKFLFSPNNYKELLINSKVFSKIFLKNYIDSFLKVPNFKNNLLSLHKFPIYDIDSVLSDDTFSNESDILRNINCFNVQDTIFLLSLFFEYFIIHK